MTLYELQMWVINHSSATLTHTYIIDLDLSSRIMLQK